MEQAKGLEMDAISAAVVGGKLLSGGGGTPVGKVFGVRIKGTLTRLITSQGSLSSWVVRIGIFVFVFFFVVL